MTKEEAFEDWYANQVISDIQINPLYAKAFRGISKSSWLAAIEWKENQQGDSADRVFCDHAGAYETSAGWFCPKCGEQTSR